ncbi:MAG: FtsW/RodA/SpoVE family cell cycle protein [Phycisphaerales bacterium]
MRTLIRVRGEAWTLVLASLALSILGVYAIDVASGPHEGLSSLATRQIAFLGAGLFLGLIAAAVHFRILIAASWLLYGASLALLIFLLVPGVPASIVTPRNGARAWIDLGPVNLQPSEFAKIAVVIVLAQYLRFRSNHRRFLGFIPPAVIAGVPAALVVLEPDLGMASLFAPALFAMLIAAGAKMRHILAVLVLGAALAPAVYPFLMPHQKERIVALVRQTQGDLTLQDSSQFQSLKAMTLAGAGGAAGLPSEHSRVLIDLNDLPEAHNDMVFAVIVNRFGMLGGLSVLALTFIWLLSASIAAARTNDPFGRLIIVGLAAMFATQTIINVGMSLGVLPIIGLTLPFVSYGGSSLLSSYLGVGLIVSVAARPNRRLARRSFEFGADTSED